MTKHSTTPTVVTLIYCALTSNCSPIISKLVPASIPYRTFHLQFNQREGDRAEPSSLIDYQFSSHDVVTVTICTLIGLWYIFQKVIKSPRTETYPYLHLI